MRRGTGIFRSHNILSFPVVLFRISLFSSSFYREEPYFLFRHLVFDFFHFEPFSGFNFENSFRWMMSNLWKEQTGSRIRCHGWPLRGWFTLMARLMRLPQVSTICVCHKWVQAWTARQRRTFRHFHTSSALSELLSRSSGAGSYTSPRARSPRYALVASTAVRPPCSATRWCAAPGDSLNSLSQSSALNLRILYMSVESTPVLVPHLATLLLSFAGDASAAQVVGLSSTSLDTFISPLTLSSYSSYSLGDISKIVSSSIRGCRMSGTASSRSRGLFRSS